MQQLKYAMQQKDRQLAEAKRTNHFLETALQDEQLQKEAAWRHNKEFFATVQHLKTNLQNKSMQCCTLEKGTSLRMQRQDQKIKDLTYNLACKEWLLQESKDLLEYYQNLDKNSTTADKIQAIGEKFSALEDREQELNQLYLSIKEQDCDLKGLHQVISGNKTTIQCLESLLKAKDLELEKLLAANQNLQWLIKNIEAKSQKWQSEQERIIQKLHDRNKEVETLSATLLCNLEPGQRDTIEALHLHLQQKDQIIKEFLWDKSQQVVDPIYSKKMAQVLTEKNSELQILNQQLISQILHQKMELSIVQFVQQEGSIDLKLSTLQSVVASQEEELQVQSSDIESLTRSTKIKEELIKDLQMQLIDPEEIPAIERLTQEVLMLQEKIAKMEAQGQEAIRDKRQQLLVMLEGLVAEKKQLNETLKVEKQLYCDLVKFHAHPDRQEQILQVELEKIQALHGQLERVLGKSQERLSRLESLDGIGGGEQERVTILPKHAC
ncbi:Myomegalin [Ophiophagus hannah]|uniref:Myomegalin n=1 Tax=Ophiophagus hannah TaxID=8665 RepID=V8NAU9_OPHHA|nr:Myomegalin [Ophiophagus hannah]